MGSTYAHPGCRDSTLPLKSSPIIFDRDLYFANQANGWEGHGVGFISTERNPSTQTLGRKHLIKQDQFIDLIKQENKNHDEFELDFEKAIKTGQQKIRDTNWYGQMLYLGHDEGYPIFSFTALRHMHDRINPPNRAYLKTIIEGIKEMYSLTDEEIVQYLLPLQGINGHFEAAELMSLVKQKFEVEPVD